MQEDASTTQDLHREALRHLDGSPEDRLSGLFRALGAVQYELSWVTFMVGQVGSLYEAAQVDPGLAETLRTMLGTGWDQNVDDLQVAVDTLQEYLQALREDSLANFDASFPGRDDAEGRPIGDVLPQADPEFPWVVLDRNGVVDRFPTEADANEYLIRHGDETMRVMEVTPS